MNFEFENVDIKMLPEEMIQLGPGVFWQMMMTCREIDCTDKSDFKPNELTENDDLKSKLGLDAPDNYLGIDNEEQKTTSQKESMTDYLDEVFDNIEGVDYEIIEGPEMMDLFNQQGGLGSNDIINNSKKDHFEGMDIEGINTIGDLAKFFEEYFDYNYDQND